MPNITPILPPTVTGGGGGSGALDDDISKSFTFTSGLLTGISSSNGTKTLNYVDGVLSSIIATGSYRSKTITYNLDGTIQSVTVA